MGTSTRENGRPIKHTDTYILMIKTHREPIFTWTEQSTLVNGLMINRTEREKKFGLMALATRGSITRAKSTEEDNSSGPMDQSMRENSS